MATRGRIGVLRPDGRVESIYNHYDSYPEGLGEALKKITNPKDIDELIKLGNRKSTYADEDWRDKNSLFNEPSKFYKNEEDFYNNDDDDSDYRYLFKDGAWWIGEPDGWDRNVREFYKKPQDLANKLISGKKTPVRLTNPQSAIKGGEGKIQANPNADIDEWLGSQNIALDSPFATGLTDENRAFIRNVIKARSGK